MAGGYIYVCFEESRYKIVRSYYGGSIHYQRLGCCCPLSSYVMGSVGLWSFCAMFCLSIGLTSEELQGIGVTPACFKGKSCREALSLWIWASLGMAKINVKGRSYCQPSVVPELEELRSLVTIDSRMSYSISLLIITTPKPRTQNLKTQHL